MTGVNMKTRLADTQIPYSSRTTSSTKICSDSEIAQPTAGGSTDKPNEDEWLGVLSRPTRGIPHTHYFLSRNGNAIEPSHDEQRFNSRGYDRDDPKDALVKYENAHPESLTTKAWNWATSAVTDIFTLGIPHLLSASAGAKKQRIDQKVVLRITREAVDKFPELKIRMTKEALELMDPKDQQRWHKKMAIIRAAQHDYVVNELAKIYPNHIDQNAPTILYSGGRATGLLRVLYCSVDEYIALYWSDWGLLSTDSGSYNAHVYDYVVEGNNVNWNARFLEYRPSDFEVTEPGEYTFLGKGDRKIWSFEGPCGMVDQGIGNVTSMAKFATISNITTTLNLRAIGDLLSNQAKAVAHEYGQRFKEHFGPTTISVTPVSRVSEAELTKAREYFSRITERINDSQGH
jgi:hypothetical protein